jgi:hypothetical protein
LSAGALRPYHASTEFEVWLQSKETYRIPVNQNVVSAEFEPYCVVPSRIESVDDNGAMLPFMLWDEIFTDYGRNKIVFLNMLRSLFGYTFAVLPDVNLFHKRHLPTAKASLFKKNPEVKGMIVNLFQSRMMFWFKKGLKYRQIDPNQMKSKKDVSFQLPLNLLPTIIAECTGDQSVKKNAFDKNADMSWREPAISNIFEKSRKLSKISSQDDWEDENKADESTSNMKEGIISENNDDDTKKGK